MSAFDESNLDEFVMAYLECALFAETDNADDSGGEPLDRNFGIEDFSDEARVEAMDECKDFMELVRENVRDVPEDYEVSQAGHDFWLTRNGHGAGYWDRGLGDVGDALTKWAKSMGTRNVIVGDDGKLFFG